MIFLYIHLKHSIYTGVPVVKKLDLLPRQQKANRTVECGSWILTAADEVHSEALANKAHEP